jgi:hypothetical protein
MAIMVIGFEYQLPWLYCIYFSDAGAAGQIKSSRTVTRDLRKQEFKALLTKDDKKIESLTRMAEAQEETNRILMMFYEKMFGN